MKLRTDIKNLDKVLTKAIKNLQRKVTRDTAETIHEKFFDNTQLEMLRLGVTGGNRLLNSVQPVFTQKGAKSYVITKFNNAGAILLEKGAVTPVYKQLGYPRFVSFAEEPSLKFWVENSQYLNENKRLSFLQRGGLVVGDPATTSFGKKRWLDSAVFNTKQEMKSRIVEKIKNI